MKKMKEPLYSFLNEYRKIFMTMRISAFLILLTGMQAIAGIAYSQATKLSLNKHNATVKEVLMEIEEKVNFTFCTTANWLT